MHTIRKGADHAAAGHLIETRDSLNTAMILNHNRKKSTRTAKQIVGKKCRPCLSVGDTGMHRTITTSNPQCTRPSSGNRKATQGADNPSPEHTRRSALDWKMKPRSLACRLKLAAARCLTGALRTVGSSAADERTLSDKHSREEGPTSGRMHSTSESNA